MLTLIFLSLAATAQGQYPYPSAAPYPPAVRVAQPTTHVVSPVAVQSGGLHSTHFRSGPYPPAEPVLLAPASGTGPYPPAQPVLLAPASSGPYPPSLPLLEGGDVSPVEEDSPRAAHTTYSLPRIVPGQLQGPTSSYPLKPEQLRSHPASYPTQHSNQYPKLPNQFADIAPSPYSTHSNPFQPYPNQPSPLKSSPNQPNTLQSYRSQPNPLQSYPSQPNTLQSLPNQPNPLQSYANQPSSLPSYPSTPKKSSPLSSFPSYPSPPGQSPSFETSNNIPPSPEPFQSGGEVSPDELEIPPNSQIKLQDKRLQYSHGFSDDKGTAVREQGSLLSTNDGWEYVIAKKGSYSYTSPEGKHINVNYIADHNGFRVIT